MNILALAITVGGLALFETISSIDNAIVNAEVLATMRPKARKWFLLWGLLFAVFVVRGLLPWAIVWASNPALGPFGALTATFSNDPSILQAIDGSTPILLLGGGIFLVLLFLHWIFLEDKKIGLPHERFFLKEGIWFYAVSSIFLAIIVWFAIQTDYISGDDRCNILDRWRPWSLCIHIISADNHPRQRPRRFHCPPVDSRKYQTDTKLCLSEKWSNVFYSIFRHHHGAGCISRRHAWLAISPSYIADRRILLREVTEASEKTCSLIRYDEFHQTG